MSNCGNSTAIFHYIAGQKPSALLPQDARSHADIIRWQSWGLAHWGAEACEPLLFERLVKQILNMGAPDEAVVAAATEQFKKCAKVLETHLSKQPYLVGNGITVADFSVAAPLFYADRGGFPLAEYPKVREWFGRVSARSRAGRRLHHSWPRRRRVSCPGRGAARSAAQWCAADPGPRLILKQAGSRVCSASLTCRAAPGTRHQRHRVGTGFSPR